MLVDLRVKTPERVLLTDSKIEHPKLHSPIETRRKESVWIPQVGHEAQVIRVLQSEERERE